MRRATLIGLVLAAAVAGCGSSGNTSSGGGIDKNDLARQLADAVQANQGADLSDVSCIQRTARVYRCGGTYQASRKTARMAYPGVDKSAWTDADWQAVIEQQSGPITFDVTVDPQDGSFIYEPV